MLGGARVSTFRAARVVGVSVTLALLLVACGTGNQTTGQQLATDQTYRIPIVNDVGTLDPVQGFTPWDYFVEQNLFNGLYKFTNDLTEVPDIATGLPDVSADGLTYTFHIRADVKFWNGDPVTAQDFVWTWSRNAAYHAPYSGVFEPVAGYADVEANKTKVLSGLSVIDDHTFRAVLSHAAGYWLTELGLWISWVLDPAVVTKLGQDTWWTTPEGLVGTGPFRMVARVPKASLDFAAVPNWWGGKVTLQHIHIEVGADMHSSIAKYETGGLDAVGVLLQQPTPDDVLRYKNDPVLSKQLTLVPVGNTEWVQFSFINGPFAGIAAGLDGRKAFSMAVDRKQLADVVCSKSITCAPATGGVITKGLKGYLGDGMDPNAVFDPVKAKMLYQQWDPTGSKVKGMTYTYPNDPKSTAEAQNLQSQWRANLGVNVDLVSYDRATFNKFRFSSKLATFRGQWGADYDHPQDWYDFLFITGAGLGGSGYSNPQLDALVAKANAEPISQSLPEYVTAGNMMTADAVYAATFYQVQPYIIKPYVVGAGGNALYDYVWSEIKILQH
jgi:oligopeptide transport system substrate-binding protein